MHDKRSALRRSMSAALAIVALNVRDMKQYVGADVDAETGADMANTLFDCADKLRMVGEYFKTGKRL